MKRQMHRMSVVWVVVLSVFLSLGPTRFAGQRARQSTATQTPSTTTQQTPSAAPSPSPTPASVATPQLPGATPPAPRVSSSTKTLAELQTRISGILAKPELSSAMVGIKVFSLDTGKVLFEENSNK